MKGGDVNPRRVEIAAQHFPPSNFDASKETFKHRPLTAQTCLTAKMGVRTANLSD